MIWLGADGYKPSRERDKDGKRYVSADLMSDTVPSPFPVNGKDVEGLTENDLFEKGSVLYVVGNASLYIRDSLGNWVEQ